jgi:hypothetical protein
VHESQKAGKLEAQERLAPPYLRDFLLFLFEFDSIQEKLLPA